MPLRTARAALVILAPAAMAFALAARRGPQGSAEDRPQPPPAEPTPASLAMKLPPPTPAQLEGGLRRTFGEAVRPDARPPRGIVGDFNGDGVEDVAMPVRPAEGRLPELNHGLANWKVQDALAEDAARGAPSRNVERAGEATVEAGDLLLAVVHGFGPRGWRDDRARQCYLVRHATGGPLEARPRTCPRRRSSRGT